MAFNLIAAVAGPLLGGIFGASNARKQRKAAERDAEKTREVAIADEQTSFQRLRDSAIAGGFNPLTALQLQGTTYLPSGVVGPGGPTGYMDSGSAAGLWSQGIGAAMDVFTGATARRAHLETAQAQAYEAQAEAARASVEAVTGSTQSPVSTIAGRAAAAPAPARSVVSGPFNPLAAYGITPLSQRAFGEVISRATGRQEDPVPTDNVGLYRTVETADGRRTTIFAGEDISETANLVGQTYGVRFYEDFPGWYQENIGQPFAQRVIQIGNALSGAVEVLNPPAYAPDSTRRGQSPSQDVFNDMMRLEAYQDGRN